MQTLTPEISVGGKAHLMVTPQPAGIAARDLGPMVADAATDRPKVVAALDFLSAGI